MSQAAAPWKSAKIGDLRVVGPVEANRIREIARELAYIHAVHAARTPLGDKPAPAITVFALHEMGFQSKAPLGMRRRNGFSQSDMDVARILLNADAGSPWRDAMRGHFTSAWLDVHGPFPTWLHAGLSAYLSVVSYPYDGKTWIGVPCTSEQERRKGPTAGSITDVLGEVPEGREARSQFAGNSLTLVVWLLHAKQRPLEDLFKLGARAEEVGSQAALAEWGLPLESLDREVRAWQASIPCLPQLLVEPLPVPSDDAIVVESVSAQEHPLLLGELWLATERPKRALEAFEPVLRQSPNDSRALRGAAGAMFSLGNFVEATRYYERLQALGLPESVVMVAQRTMVRSMTVLAESDPAAAATLLSKADLDAQVVLRGIPHWSCSRAIAAWARWGGADGARTSLELLAGGDPECDYLSGVLRSLLLARIGEATGAADVASTLEGGEREMVQSLCGVMARLLRQMAADTPESAAELRAQADRLDQFAPELTKRSKKRKR